MQCMQDVAQHYQRIQQSPLAKQLETPEPRLSFVFNRVMRHLQDTMWSLDWFCCCSLAYLQRWDWVLKDRCLRTMMTEAPPRRRWALRATSENWWILNVHSHKWVQWQLYSQPLALRLQTSYCWNVIHLIWRSSLVKHSQGKWLE